MQTLQQIFDLAIEIGIKNDVRSKKEIEQILKDREKSFKKLDKKEKDFYDAERLKHVYSDSRIHFGDPKKKIKKIMAGVDMETSELLLASELNRRGAKIDAVMGHHPEGRALLGLTGVMRLQEDMLEQLGVSPNIAEKLMAPRISELDRALHAINAFRESMAAELLDLPYFNIHTPADNCAYQYMNQHVCSKKFKNLGEVVEAIYKIPEYEISAKRGNPPEIFVGSKSSKPGKIAATGFTGGTSGSKHLFEKLAQAGVGTIIKMHISEENKKEAEKHHLNVIICSHMASDSLGMNHILDQYEKNGVEILPASGFIRVKRK